MDELIRKGYFSGELNFGNDEKTDYDYKLKDFYIKTAYNCFCSGSFRNDYVDTCALENCAAYGTRALDIQVFSLNNEPIIGSTSINVNTYKESYNYLTLKKGLSKIKTTLQFISISLFLAQDFLINYLNIFNIAYISLWIATILTIYTGLKYSYMTYIFNQKRK